MKNESAQNQGSNSLVIRIDKKRHVQISIIIMFLIFSIPLYVVLYNVLFNLNALNLTYFIIMAVVQGIMYAAFGIVLWRYVKRNYPIYNLHLIMNLEKIEFQIRGRTYFNELWKNFKGFELTNEKFFEKQKERIYRLKFITEQYSRELRFDVLDFTDNQIDQILYVLNKVTEKYNLKVLERTERTDLTTYSRAYRKAAEEIRQFK